MVKIPNRLLSMLKHNSELSSFVHGSMAVIEPWASDNKTVFFPEYTDHSLKHMADVMATAEGLITDESWAYITPEDSTAIIISSLLHDCSLHLTEDGFFELINGNYTSERSRYVDEELPWPRVWQEYYAAARRFDQRKLRELFGDTMPVPDFTTNKLRLTLRHRLLVGDFLRSHHARLAHEIALAGIPGIKGKRVKIGKMPKENLDLYGFVARSHNLSLRCAVDALEKNKRRVHMNCHVPYVMSLLRVSDYIQVQSSRAPKQVLNLKTIVSPVSKVEWLKHKSIVEITRTHDDPEAIYIDCEPPDVNSFLSLKWLLENIQNELDQVWAVLGEVYGRFAPLNYLGINVRRIKSSIDNADRFARDKNPQYIPGDFRLRTASGELMDLLVGPLYGDRPEIGIRELVQNSVDACLERDDLIEKQIISERTEYPSDVMVTLYKDKNNSKIVVEDYGVGMSIDVINNYFLNIGASFRSSDTWRKYHEDHQKSSVNRAGRFGIGVLAAFLLGERISVVTSHIKNANRQGVQFTVEQGSESIEIRPCRFHHGTKIEIQLDNSVATELALKAEKWDWYCLSYPKVERKIISAAERTLPQKFNIPQSRATLGGAKLNRIKSDEYKDIFWAFIKYADLHVGTEIRNRNYRNVLICNGILISDIIAYRIPAVSPGMTSIYANVPSLVVFDPDGLFPLNLQRNSISTENLPFGAELTKQLANEIVLGIINKFIDMPHQFDNKMIELCHDPKVLGMRSSVYYGSHTSLILLSERGILPTDLALIRKVRPQSILIDPIAKDGTAGAWMTGNLFNLAEYYCAYGKLSDTKTSRSTYYKAVIGSKDGHYYPKGLFGELPISGRRIFFRKDHISELLNSNLLGKRLWRKLISEFENDVWGTVTSGAVPPYSNPSDCEVICSKLNSSKSIGFTIFYFDWNSDLAIDKIESPMAKAWLKIVGNPFLHVGSLGS